MAIQRFFDHEVIIYRLKTVSGNLKAFNTTATVEMAIQEMDRQTRTELEINQERAWIGYFDIAVEEMIKEGDKIVDDNGTVYKVVEKTMKDYGINQHVEIIFVDFDNT